MLSIPHCDFLFLIFVPQTILFLYRYHFILCNPPFYSSSDEIATLAQEKALPPSAVCTGAPVEMIYEPNKSAESGEALEEGGEAGFVTRMVEESVLFGTRCRCVCSQGLPVVTSIAHLTNSTQYAF
jgi:23S rRNA A1618 N6-methylase RlmF